MPRFGIKSLLIAFASIALWLSTIAAYPGSGDVRSIIVLLLLRSAFKSRRCLIPASGFFEWKPEGKQKQPYYFRRPDDKPLAFAGLWEQWNEIESCTIITTGANAVMAPVHHRMPVVLGVNDYAHWLDPAATDLLPLLAPCPDDELICYPVDRFVNNARNQGPQCIERVE